MVDEVFAGRSSKKYSESKLLKDIRNKEELSGDDIREQFRSLGDTLPKLPNASVPQLLIAPNMEGGIGTSNPITQGYNTQNFLADKKIGKFSGMPAGVSQGNFDSGYKPSLDFLQSLPDIASNFLNNSTANIGGFRTTETNPLHDYEPYNYILTLSCIGGNAYNSNNFANNRGTVIAQSGGKGRQGNGALAVDYFIERASLRTVVQSTVESPSTNAFQIIMNVSEPYGTDFISALVQASKQEGYDNHMNAVYLLGIRFQGNDDNGNPTDIPIGGERFIPLRFFRVELDVDAGGSTYSIQAAPHAYIPKQNAYDFIQHQVSCTGTTVKEILESFFTNHNKALDRLAEKGKVATPNTYNLSIEGSESDILTSSMNTDDQLRTTAKQQTNISIRGGNEHKPTSRKIVVEKGESIMTFIRYVLDNSAFFLNRLGDNQEVEGRNIPVPNIMTDATVISSNNGIGDIAYGFEYSIRSQLQDISNVDPSKSPARVNPVRKYDFIYTGENKDVLNFNLQYRFAYFQPELTLTAEGDSTPENDPALEQGQTRHSSASSFGQGQTNDKEMVGVNVTRGGGQDFGTMPASVISGNDSGDILPDADADNKEAINKLKQVLEDPAADMIVCELEILGDPYWIEQKTVRPGTKTQSQAGPYVEPDGSISVDGHAPIIEINAKLPADIDDATGLYQLNDTPFFQGTFQVWMCESNFEGGVFTQTLSLIRQKGQNRDKQQGGISARSTAGTLGSGSFFDSDLGKGSYDSLLTPSTSNVINQGKSAFSRPPRNIKKLVSNQGKPIKTKSGYLTRGKNPFYFRNR